jgi:hypothetical protein
MIRNLTPLVFFLLDLIQSSAYEGGDLIIPKIPFSVVEPVIIIIMGKLRPRKLGRG